MNRKLSINKAEDLAQSYRAKWELSSSAPIHIKTILRKLRVLTVYRPLSDKFYGLSAKSSADACFILVNSRQTRADQHFTIAHELYHLFVDGNNTVNTHMEIVDSQSKDNGEYNADLFASAFLMPKCAIQAMIPDEELKNKQISIATLFQIEQYFAVSREIALKRLSELNLIGDSILKELQNSNARELASSYGYDSSLYQPGNENLVLGDFGNKVHRLFEAGRISEGHYNELINLISYV